MAENEHESRTAQDADVAHEESLVEAEDVSGERVEHPLHADVDTSPTESVETLRERLAQVEKSLAEADLRAQAEIQNMRKRAERDVESAHKFALEKFARDILAVADGLERGLATLPESDAALQSAREGTSLTLKLLMDVLGKYQIEAIDPAGKVFDPQQHEAMAMVPMPGAAPNSIIEVVQKGYTLNGRLLRPAMVVVAKEA